MADTIGALQLIVDSSGAVAGYKAAAAAADQLTGATSRASQAEASGAQAAQQSAAATGQSAQAKQQAVAAALRLAQANEASVSASLKAAKATLDHARAAGTLSVEELKSAQALVQTIRLRQQAAAASTAAARAETLHGQAIDTGGKSAGLARIQFGNLGQQIQDVAVQASAGTDAMIILAQQGPQIASGFGPAGIAIGAVVGVAAAAALVFGVLGSASDRAAKAAEEQKDKTDDLLESLRLGGETAAQFASSLESLGSSDRSLAAASLAAQVDTLTQSLVAAREEAEKAGEAIPNALRNQAQPVNPTAAGPFVGAIQAAREERLGTNRAGEAEALLAEFQKTGEGADLLRTRLIALGQAQGLSATEASRLANDLVNTTGQVGLLERSTAELEARQRIAARTATDLDYAIVSQADAATKAASALDAYNDTITTLRNQRVLASISDPIEKAVEAANQRARLGDRPDASPSEAAALREEVVATEAAVASAQKLDEQRRRSEAGQEAAAKRIAAARTQADPNNAAALEASVRAQNEGATEQQIQELIGLEKAQRAATAAKRDDRKVDAGAERRAQFVAGLELETEQLGRLKGALGESSTAYEHEANVLEVIRRVRAAGFDVSTAEGQAIVQRSAAVRDETESLQRQANVRRELDNITRRATATPGLDASGQELDLPQLVGLTPQSIEEVVARAEFVRGVIEKLGAQKDPAILADAAKQANQAFNLQTAADRGAKGTLAQAELKQEAEQQERLGSVIRGTASARQEMENRIAAENKVLGILGTTETAAAKALIETDIANRRRAQGIEGATQLTVEYADATAVLRDRLAEIAQQEAAGADPASVARARREAQRKAVRDQAEEFEETDDPFKGAQAGLLRLQDQTGTLASAISGQLSDSLQEGVDGFVDLGMAGDLTWGSLGEGLERFATDMTASIAKMLIMQAVLRTIGGTGAGTTGGGTGLLGAFFGGQAHQGGVVGEGGARRMADPMWFKHAPRYHSGGLVLGRDEVPIIAQRGERVQSRQEVAGQWGMQKAQRPIVNIHNYSGEPTEQRDRDGPNGPELDVIVGGSVNRHIAGGRANKPLESKFSMKKRLY